MDETSEHITADERRLQAEAQLRQSFEARLPQMASRATSIQFQHAIPNHWFAQAASECISMFIAGSHYGTISVAQTYVEALSKFLAEKNQIKAPKNDPKKCWRTLREENVVSEQAEKAATLILKERNDFHHLNKSIEQDERKLEAKASRLIGLIFEIESEIFGYSFKKPGSITVHRPNYWTLIENDKVEVFLRNIR